MYFRKFIFFVFVTVSALLTPSSCTKIYLEEPVDRQIVIFSAIGGAGDNGYNDLITKGLTRVYMDHSEVNMNYLTPETIEQAENSIYKWIEESGRKAAHTLLVIASSEYRDITERILLNPDLKTDNEVEILTFEIPELPQSQNSIKAYSFIISMYGASYQAGVYAAQLGCTDPLVWLAELMKHRAADDSRYYRESAAKFIAKYGVDVSGYDVIRGWRANASYFYICKSFVRNNIGVAFLGELLRLGSLGIQYFLRTERAFAALAEIEAEKESVDAAEWYGRYNRRDRDARSKMYDIIENDPRNDLSRTFKDVL